MITPEQLDNIFTEIKNIFIKHDLGFIDAAIVWRYIGEFIFTEGGKIPKKEALEKMLLYLDDIYHDKV